MGMQPGTQTWLIRKVNVGFIYHNQTSERTLQQGHNVIRVEQRRGRIARIAQKDEFEVWI